MAKKKAGENGMEVSAGMSAADLSIESISGEGMLVDNPESSPVEESPEPVQDRASESTSSGRRPRRPDGTYASFAQRVRKANKYSPSEAIRAAAESFAADRPGLELKTVSSVAQEGYSASFTVEGEAEPVSLPIIRIDWRVGYPNEWYSAVGVVPEDFVVSVLDPTGNAADIDLSEVWEQVSSGSRVQLPDLPVTETVGE